MCQEDFEQLKKATEAVNIFGDPFGFLISFATSGRLNYRMPRFDWTGMRALPVAGSRRGRGDGN